MADMTTELTLQQEIANLRAAVNRLEAAAATRLQLVLSAPVARVFWGQPMALTAAAQWLGQGPAGTPSPARDIPITFVTSWGMLRAVDKYDTQFGTSVTTRTGLDGVARVTLLPPGAAHLDVAQQSALWTALDRLDLAAATPADLQSQLAELVGHYRWEANLLLRQAIDILHRANGAPQAGSMNPEDALTAWRHFNATVVAIAEGDEQVAATAALFTVRVLDWLRPWLQVYLQQTQTDETLPRDLDRTRQRHADPGALLDSVYGDINKYVNSQFGVIGQAMGQRVAENALRTFVNEGLAELPAETRVTLFPTLHTASETVATAGVHVLSALTQARVDLRQEIDAKAKTAGSRLDGRVGAVEQALNAKVDASIFQGFQTEIGASLTALDDQTRTLATRFTAASAASDALRGQLTALQSSVGQLTTNLGTVQDSLGQLSGRLTTVAADLTQQLATRATAADLTSLQASINTAIQGKADIQTVDTLRTELTGQLSTRVTTDALTALQTSITAALQRKADTQAVDTLRRELSDQLATRVSADDLTAFQASIDAALQRKADLAAVDTIRSDLSAQLAARVTTDEFKSFQESNATALGKKANAGSITTLRNELAGQIAGKADQAALDALKQDADGRFADLITSAGKVAAQMDVVSRSLAEINDRFGKLQSDFTVQLETNQAALTQTAATVAQLQGTVGALSTDLNTRLVGLEDQTKGVATSLTDFQKTVTNLNRDFTRLNKRIIDSGLLRPPP